MSYYCVILKMTRLSTFTLHQDIYLASLLEYNNLKREGGKIQGLQYFPSDRISLNR